MTPQNLREENAFLRSEIDSLRSELQRASRREVALVRALAGSRAARRELEAELDEATRYIWDRDHGSDE